MAEIVRQPQQERSRRTLARIERAALDLIARKGPEGAGVQEIARRARSSVGSFYARFEGKDELLRWLRARAWEGVEQSWEESAPEDESDLPSERVEGADEASAERPAELERRLRSVNDRLIRAFTNDARARRLLESHRGPGDDANHAARLLERLRGEVARELTPHLETGPGGNVEGVVAFLLSVLVPAVREYTETDHLTALIDGLDDATMAHELTRMALGYLGAPVRPAPGQQEPEQIEFFEVWG